MTDHYREAERLLRIAEFEDPAIRAQAHALLAIREAILWPDRLRNRERERAYPVAADRLPRVQDRPQPPPPTKDPGWPQELPPIQDRPQPAPPTRDPED